VIIDYDLDATNLPIPCLASTSSNQSSSVDTSCAAPPKIDYAAEIRSLKAELTELRKIITEAVEQIKSAIVSLPQQSTSLTMTWKPTLHILQHPTNPASQSLISMTLSLTSNMKLQP